MGRIVDASEHRMAGTVTVGRPVSALVLLPRWLLDRQARRLAKINDLRGTLSRGREPANSVSSGSNGREAT